MCASPESSRIAWNWSTSSTARSRRRTPKRLSCPTTSSSPCVGQTADFGLFAHLGVPLSPDGLPEYDEKTAETAVPGLYVAGSLSRANIILESRRRAVEIVAEVVARLKQSQCIKSDGTMKHENQYDPGPN